MYLYEAEIDNRPQIDPKTANVNIEIHLQHTQNCKKKKKVWKYF